MSEVLDQAVQDVRSAAGKEEVARKKTPSAEKPPSGGKTYPGLSDDTRPLVPDLLTVPEAGRILRVSDATIRNWIGAGSIPYVELPSTGPARKQYRIPLQGLLNSLEGTYNLKDALIEQNARMRAANLPED